MFRHDQLGVGGGCSFGLHLWDRAHPLPANFLENFSTFASGGFKHTSSIQYSENSRLWLRFVEPCTSSTACKFPSKLISLYVNRISDCLDLLNKKTDAQWIVCFVLSVFKYTTMSWTLFWVSFSLSPQNSFFLKIIACNSRKGEIKTLERYSLRQCTPYLLLSFCFFGGHY